jgi:hypothetical protein
MYVLATPYLHAEYKQTELAKHQQIKTTLCGCTYVHALEEAKKAPSKLDASCGFNIHSELRGNLIARLHVNPRPSNGTALVHYNSSTHLSQTLQHAQQKHMLSARGLPRHRRDHETCFANHDVPKTPRMHGNRCPTALVWAPP